VLYLDNLFLQVSSICKENVLIQFALYILISYCYKQVVSSASWETALFSVRITRLIFFVFLLKHCKEIPGKYLVISHNHFHISSNSFSCYPRHYLTFLSAILTSLADSHHNYHDNTYCVYTVLRYSWWWAVDLSETCRVPYKINMRNSASCWLSL
jgi:hypothetical protein